MFIHTHRYMKVGLLHFLLLLSWRWTQIHTNISSNIHNHLANKFVLYAPSHIYITNIFAYCYFEITFPSLFCFIKMFVYHSRCLIFCLRCSYSLCDKLWNCHEEFLTKLREQIHHSTNSDHRCLIIHIYQTKILFRTHSSMLSYSKFDNF